MKIHKNLPRIYSNSSENCYFAEIFSKMVARNRKFRTENLDIWVKIVIFHENCAF